MKISDAVEKLEGYLGDKGSLTIAAMEYLDKHNTTAVMMALDSCRKIVQDLKSIQPVSGEEIEKWGQEYCMLAEEDIHWDNWDKFLAQKLNERMGIE